MDGIFVTGTDTGVGKTVVSAVLINTLRESQRVCYWKPVQTGIEEDDDTDEVRKLAGCDSEEIYDHGIRLERPLSPHLSARLADTRISFSGLLKTSEEASALGRTLVVEGAGGIFVPINESAMMIDLIAALKMPVLVVSRSGLGTINHTLLTLEAFRSRMIPVVGVVMNGAKNAENKKAIEEYGKVSVIGEVPVLEPLSRDTLAGVRISL